MTLDVVNLNKKKVAMNVLSIKVANNKLNRFRIEKGRYLIDGKLTNVLTPTHPEINSEHRQQIINPPIDCPLIK